MNRNLLNPSLSYVKRAAQLDEKFNPPAFVVKQLQYEVIGGSTSYGIQSDSSDVDVYGFCIPPEYYLYPHLQGKIAGFGSTPKEFNQYQVHRVNVNNTQCDFGIYGITRFFHLCMGNNPNMVDLLFVPEDCILTMTPIGKLVRDNRKLFLSKQSYHTFRGYAHGQLNLLKKPHANNSEKRQALVKKYGYDSKYLSHVVRLALESIQILREGDLDLRRHGEFLTQVRNGYFKDIAEGLNWFNDSQLEMEEAYNQSTLPERASEEDLHKLLEDCLNLHYGRSRP